MQTQLQHFDNFDLETQIRVLIQEEQPWFIVKDICQYLGIVNSRDAITSLDEDEKTNFTSSNVGISDIRLPNRGLQAVSESGLYALIFKSKKPEAKKFRKWVTSEVLPAIRQTGKYDPAALLASQPPIIRHAAIYGQIAELEARILRLRAEADASILLAGQFTAHIWSLMRGEDIRGAEIARASYACKRAAILADSPIGYTRVVEHCGQITRLSRNAMTFDPSILTAILGPIKQPA